MPSSRRPEDIDSGWAECLTRVYGDESWRNLYEPSRQLDLFKDTGVERRSGVEGLLSIYAQKLRDTFEERFMDTSRTLKNTRGAPLFELLFCVGNPKPKAINVATNIAGHILKHI